MISKMIDTQLPCGIAASLCCWSSKRWTSRSVADRIAFLDNGTIAETATPNQLHADQGRCTAHLGVAVRA